MQLCFDEKSNVVKQQQNEFGEKIEKRDQEINLPTFPDLQKSFIFSPLSTRCSFSGRWRVYEIVNSSLWS